RARARGGRALGAGRAPGGGPPLGRCGVGRNAGERVLAPGVAGPPDDPDAPREEGPLGLPRLAPVQRADPALVGPAQAHAFHGTSLATRPTADVDAPSGAQSLMLASIHKLRHTVATGVLAGVTALGVAVCSISQREEIELGRQYAAEINRQLPLVDDPTVVRYVNLLGDRIARQGRRDLDYTFYVVNTDAVNAFAVPGGFIYVNRGLIERTANLSELAGVLAHEIAHV